MPNKTATFNTTAGSFTVELYTDTMPVTACKPSLRNFPL